MSTIARVATVLQHVVTEVADAAAVGTGFVQRRRKLTGSVFVRALVWGFLGKPQASLADLSRVAAIDGVHVSPQAVAQRCTPAAAACLQQVVAAAVQVVVGGARRLAPLLDRFTGVYVLDSSTVSLPAALASVWPGSCAAVTCAAQTSVPAAPKTGRRRFSPPPCRLAGCASPTWAITA